MHLLRLVPSLLVALALLLAPVALLAGCASLPRPVPLAPLFEQSNTLAERLNEESRAHEDRVKQEMVSLARACPAEPVEERRRCVYAVAGRVVQSPLWDDSLLGFLAFKHADAKQALQDAEACRKALDEACVTKKTTEAREMMAEIEAALAYRAPSSETTTESGGAP